MSDWVIESASKLYSKESVVNLHKSLAKTDLFIKLGWTELYSLYVIFLFEKYFSFEDDWDHYTSEQQKEKFLKYKKDFDIIFQAFDLCIYFEQRDKRNIFVFDKYLYRTKANRLIKSSLFNIKEVQQKVLKKSKNKKIVNAVFFYLERVMR